MVMGDVESESTNKAGNKVWRSRTPGSGKVLVIEFGRDGRVMKAEVDRTTTAKKRTSRKTSSKKTTSKKTSWQDKNGTPIQ